MALLPAYEFAARVFVGGTNYTDALTGVIRVEAEVRKSRVAEFVLKFTTVPEGAPISLVETDKFVGLPVAIEGGIAAAGGGAPSMQSIFVGVVDYAAYDPSTRTTRFSCSDLLQDFFNEAAIPDPAGVDAYIPGGLYSANYHGEHKDGWSRAEDLLSNVWLDVFQDNDGAIQNSSWNLGGVASTFAADEVIAGSVAVDTMARSDITTLVRLTLDHSYTRLYQHEIQYSWYAFALASGVHNVQDFGTFLTYPYALPTRETFEGAASSSGWKRTTPFGVTQLPRAGSYGGRSWTPGVNSRQSVFESVGWRLRNRWTRSRKDVYVMNLTNIPGSVGYTGFAGWGNIVQELTASTPYDFDTTSWESSDDTVLPTTLADVTNPWDEFTYDGSLSGGQPGTYHRDEYDEATRTNDFNVLINTGIRILYEGIRQNYVTWLTIFDPTLDLGNGYGIDTAEVEADGMAYQIEHVLDVGQGSATTRIRIAVARGHGVDGALTGAPKIFSGGQWLDLSGNPVPVPDVPEITDDPALTESYAISNYAGGVPGTTPAPDALDALTNVWLTNYGSAFLEEGTNNPDADVDEDDQQARTRTVSTLNDDIYPTEMRVEPDPIPDSIRDEKVSSPAEGEIDVSLALPQNKLNLYA